MKTLNYLRFTASILSLVVLTSIIGCQKEDNGKDPFRAKINVKCIELPNTDFDADTIKVTLAAAGQSLNLRISASQDVTWQTSIRENDKPFASFAPMDGGGFSATTFTVKSNTSGVERKFEVLFFDSLYKKARRLFITQPAL